MPQWMEIIWSVMAPLLVLSVAWLAKSVMGFRADMVAVQHDLLAIRDRCRERSADVTEYRKKTAAIVDSHINAINRIDRNILKLGAQVGATNLSEPSD